MFTISEEELDRICEDSVYEKQAQGLLIKVHVDNGTVVPFDYPCEYTVRIWIPDDKSVVTMGINEWDNDVMDWDVRPHQAYLWGDITYEDVLEEISYLIEENLIFF